MVLNDLDNNFDPGWKHEMKVSSMSFCNSWSLG
jgi:hypothetical protein